MQDKNDEMYSDGKVERSSIGEKIRTSRTRRNIYLDLFQ